MTRLVAALRRALAATGAFVRTRASFFLRLVGLAWGVLREGGRPTTWRRTVRYEFRRTLRQAAGGGLFSAIFTGGLAGLGLVSQTLYWLGLAGLIELTGSILVTVLVRELGPVLVGVILLGRSGMLAVAELGMLQSGGQVRTMLAEGLDPFLLFVLPRSLAFAVASFTLGMAFALASLSVGFLASEMFGTIHGSLPSFLDHVLAAMQPRDYVIIPAKFALIGFLVGVSACLSGLSAAREDELSSLLPRGFARGILTVMTVDIAFTVAF